MWTCTEVMERNNGNPGICVEWTVSEGGFVGDPTVEAAGYGASAGMAVLLLFLVGLAVGRTVSLMHRWIASRGV